MGGGGGGGGGGGTKPDEPDVHVPYIITFDPNGGTVGHPDGATGKDGTLYSLPIPTWEGYDFTGWFTGKTDGTAVTDSTVFISDSTVYALWKIKNYTVRFNANGGEVTLESAVTGDGWKLTLTALPTPARDGYIFSGWFTASIGGDEVTVDKVYHANTTVYAHWTAKPTLEPDTYLIEFNANGGTLEVDPPYGITDTDGKLAKLPAATELKRDDYTFVGWFTAAEGGESVTVDKVYSASATIYAQWTINNYTVTFNSQGGGDVPPQPIDHDGKVTKPTDPTPPTGYTFGGWYKEAACTNVWDFNTDVVKSATILYAKWNAIPAPTTFTIKFDVHGGDPLDPAKATVTTGTDGKLAASAWPEPNRDCFSFAGWYTEAGGGGVKREAGFAFTANATLHAHWTETVGCLPPYTITFWSPDDETELTTAQTGADGILAAVDWPADPTRGNYFVFVGWYTEDGTERLPKNHVFTTATDLYAHWEASYTVSYNLNGGTGISGLLWTGEGGKLTVLDPTRENYTFDGWFFPHNPGTQGVKVDLNTYVFTANGVNIVAEWTWSGGFYTIKFHPNYGETSDTENLPSAETGVDFKLAHMPSESEEPTHPQGYNFDGWWTELTDGEGDRVNTDYVFSGDKTVPIIIYAHWTQKPTSGTYIDTRDNNKPYPWKKIGSLEWMTKNLDYAGEDGDLGACYNYTPYTDEIANCETYGRLYTWADAQVACPVSDGWRLAIVSDWEAMFNEFDGMTAATATVLKSDAVKDDGTGYWSTPGTNESGLSVLPGGYYFSRFRDLGTSAYFMSSSVGVAGSSGRFLTIKNTGNPSWTGNNNNMASVRCVRN